MTAFRDAWFRKGPKPGATIGMAAAEMYAVEPIIDAAGDVLAYHALLTAEQYAYHDARNAFDKWAQVAGRLTKVIKDKAGNDKVVPTHVFGAGIVADDGTVILADHSVPATGWML